MRHPEKLREQRREFKQKQNEESFRFATRSRRFWDYEDDMYLLDHAQDMTARDIGWNLGRSYEAIILMAFKRKIPMMTEDKKHGRLVTSRA